MTTRRGFLGAILAAAAAPAIVRTESLMKIWVPPAPKILTWADFADGERDATSFIQGLINAGGRVIIPAGSYAISASLQLKSGISLLGQGAKLTARRPLDYLLYAASDVQDCTIKNIYFERASNPRAII